MNLPTITENKVVDVDYALKEWRAYQRLCKELLDDSDYQEYTQKDKKTGKQITKRFPKKSAWAKLGRAFNVRIHINQDWCNKRSILLHQSHFAKWSHSRV